MRLFGWKKTARRRERVSPEAAGGMFSGSAKAQPLPFNRRQRQCTVRAESLAAQFLYGGLPVHLPTGRCIPARIPRRKFPSARARCASLVVCYDCPFRKASAACRQASGSSRIGLCAERSSQAHCFLGAASASSQAIASSGGVFLSCRPSKRQTGIGRDVTVLVKSCSTTESHNARMQPAFPSQA